MPANSIFKAGSRTYFTSSLFFPKDIRREVTILYNFVRVADDLVDRIPQDAAGFYHFKGSYDSARRGAPCSDPVISEFIELSQKRNFDPRWVEAFLKSMEMDLTKKTYANLAEIEEYIYGSAEVIGSMMALILKLDIKALEYARLQGKAMQYINFLRDIAEDQTFGRTYLPREQLLKCGLTSLKLDEAKKQPQQFRAFIRGEIGRYRSWQAQASEGYKFIPRRYLIPVKTAANMYAWTAGEIEKDPFIVYRKKVKPSVLKILFGILYNTLT